MFNKYIEIFLEAPFEKTKNFGILILITVFIKKYLKMVDFLMNSINKRMLLNYNKISSLLDKILFLLNNEKERILNKKQEKEIVKIIIENYFLKILYQKIDDIISKNEIQESDLFQTQLHNAFNKEELKNKISNFLSEEKIQKINKLQIDLEKKLKKELELNIKIAKKKIEKNKQEIEKNINKHKNSDVLYKNFEKRRKIYKKLNYKIKSNVEKIKNDFFNIINEK